MTSWLTFFASLILLSVGCVLLVASVTAPDRFKEFDPALLAAGGVLAGGGLTLASVWLAPKLTAKTEARREKRNLQIELGAGQEFAGIDLNDRDLSGFSLPGKNFTGAYFIKADLRGAKLHGRISRTHGSTTPIFAAPGSMRSSLILATRSFLARRLHRARFNLRQT